jgi:2-polyprenyl-3-methyl-5-hydroxy-6-metoxy-1,4-benzoquinol methylase
MDIKQHWENIYSTKKLEDVSWYQQKPKTSLYFLKKFKVPKSAKIIDVGGGDSLLVDFLLKAGYHDITVLDISEKAIEKAKARLNEKAGMVKWIIADASTFIADQKYDFWHDRAAFHFLTDQTDANNYILNIKNSLAENGHLIIGTFSEKGPKKCSGIEIQQYSESSLSEKFKDYFQKIFCIKTNHKTPFDTLQNFVFCSFRLNEMIFNN